MSDFSQQCKAQLKAFIAFSKDWLANTWTFIKDIWQILLAITILIIAAIWITDPVPEGRVHMATGPTGSASESLGKRYKEFFAQQGVNLVLVPSDGSLDNIRLLQDKTSPVVAAFVTSGSTNYPLPNVKTLGAIDYQPLWCFFNQGQNPLSPGMVPTIEHKKINVGPKLSGTYALMSRILELNGYDITTKQFYNLSNNDAVKAIQNHEIDALCMIDTLESTNIQTLQNTKGVSLAGSAKAETYSKLIPGLSPIVMPAGGFNVKTNQPDKDITIAATHTEHCEPHSPT